MIPWRASAAWFTACSPFPPWDVARALDRPCLFTDTGIYALLQALLDRGASKRRLIAKVAGGAAALGEDSIFNIGERNYRVLKKVLQKNQINIESEAVGGAIGRTMYLRMRDGATLIRIGSEKILL